MVKKMPFDASKHLIRDLDWAKAKELGDGPRYAELHEKCNDNAGHYGGTKLKGIFWQDRFCGIKGDTNIEKVTISKNFASIKNSTTLLF
jgi:hypothetical protein